MLCCLITVLTILLIILDRWKPQKFKKVHNQLGCDFLYLPFIGHGYILFGGENRLRSYAKIAHQCYRNKHSMISFWYANRLFVGISDPIQARAVLKTCLDKGLSNLAIPVLGNLSAFAPVEEWKHRRKIIRSVLDPRFIKHYVEIFANHSKKLCHSFSAEASKGDFSSSEYFFVYALNTICETSIGISENPQKNQKHHPIKQAIQETMESFISRIVQPWQQIDAVYKLTENYWKQNKNKRITRDYINGLILKNKLLKASERIGVPEKNSEGPNKKTIVKLLTDIPEDYAFTDVDILDELVLLIIASTDTTTLSAGFICVLLSQYPDVQEKAYKEIKNIIGDSNKKFNLKDLDELKYIEAIIKEVIRLYPPGPMILRLCDNDIEMPTGMTLPEGTSLLINIYGINRNPHYWGADAEVFRPERFLEGYPSHPAAFMSFSYGPRNCAGYSYAMTSLKILFSHILRHYNIKPASCKNAKEERCTADIMIRPINGFKVQIEPR